MSRKREITTTEEPLTHLIEAWNEHKTIANDALQKLTTANEELTAYLTEHKPLPDKYRLYSKLRRLNSYMSIYTNKLPLYLKQVRSGKINHKNADQLPILEDICNEAQCWKRDYNEAVKTYNTLTDLYRLSFYNSDGTFNFVDWIS